MMQLTEVGDYEAQTFKLKQMYNRSRNVNITTEPPILVMCRFSSQINNKMDKDFFGNVWIKAEKDVREYPIGTKFKALMGGHWIRTERGFKWCTGSTFPNVGGDWTGEVCLP